MSLFELTRTESPEGGAQRDQIVAKRWIAETTSTSAGNFVLDGPPRGLYEFLAAHPTGGHMVGERQVDGTPITLQLRATPRVKGRVVYDQLPLGSAAVRSVTEQQLLAQSADPIPVLGLGTVTNECGEFVLSLPGRGSGDVVVAVTGSRPSDGGMPMPTRYRP